MEQRAKGSAKPAPGLSLVVPLDGSEEAKRAVGVARILPHRHIVLLHVLPDAFPLIPPPTDNEQQEWKQRAQEELEAIAGSIRTAEVTVEIDIRSGDVSGAIIDCASGHDLIVMTTSAKGAASRLLFGSVADRVSRESTTPTLLLRTNLLTGDAPAPRRIVVPLDGSARSETALPIASRIAAGLDVPIHLVQAITMDDVLATARRLVANGSQDASAAEEPYEVSRKETEAGVIHYLKRHAEELRGSGLEAEVAILHGTPVFALLDSIEADDLVVLTSHGQGGYQRWLLGSVAEKLVREAKSPVLLVPSRERGQDR
jgi:nucleotide-binding universal stress UspA family protein